MVQGKTMKQYRSGRLTTWDGKKEGKGTIALQVHVQFPLSVLFVIALTRQTEEVKKFDIYFPNTFPPIFLLC